MESRLKWSKWFQKVRHHLSYTLWVLVGLWALLNWFIVARNHSKLNSILLEEAYKSLSREKRFIYMNNNRRLCLPRGSVFALSGILSLPFLGNLPIGYGTHLTIAVPIAVKFDELGMTDKDNRFGYFDFMNLTGFPRMNISAMRLPSLLQDLPPRPFYLPSLPSISFGKKKREDWNHFPGVNYAGGDREIVYRIVGEFISNFGVDGSACVRRAICEIHVEPLMNHGFFGEALLLLLSPSLASLAEYRLGPYLEAEIHGKIKKDCKKYNQKCNFTIFTTKYSKNLKNDFKAMTNKKNDQSNLNYNNRSDIPLHREKRFFMFGPHRNILFPPSTVFVGTPTLNLPFMRDLPEGFHSEISYSVPFTLSFDDLGLTSVLNTFGNIPFLKKKKRNAAPEEEMYPGGDRELIYAVIANVLNNIGYDGYGCLMRTICELHEMPLVHHGLFGEYFQLLLTPSLAPAAQSRIPGFLSAEKIGKNCGDCSIFHEICPKSLFTNPGSGLHYHTEEERRECRQRHNFDFREENMNFARKVKLKYKNSPTISNSHKQFAQDIGNQINLKNVYDKIQNRER